MGCHLSATSQEWHTFAAPGLSLPEDAPQLTRATLADRFTYIFI